jgi:hypothetical protein
MKHYSRRKSSISNVLLLNFLLTLFLTVQTSFLYGQAPVKLWDKTIGGSSSDVLHTILQTPDSGYIAGGTSSSSAGFDKSQNIIGNSDYWVVKLDASGKKQWDKTFGGYYTEQLSAIGLTTDGGYILGGTSDSFAGADKTDDPRGGESNDDYWIVKLDAIGNKQWVRTIGGNDDDVLYSLQQTNDGGYILGGWSQSNKGFDKSENSKGGDDYWIVKLDAAGNRQWDKTLGGSGGDSFRHLQQTGDGGFILVGLSDSDAGFDKSENKKGETDGWIVKLDASGNKVWDKTFGGSNSDVFWSVQQTMDSGYIVGGFSNSNASGDKSENAKNIPWIDYWIVKLDASGTKEWDKTIGGNYDDFLRAIQQTTDGGYIVGGHSTSDSGFDKSENRRGLIWYSDYWVVKLDTSGNKQWDKTFGGNADDEMNFVQQTNDRSYILGGSSESSSGIDKSERSKGEADYWIIKLSSDGRETRSPVTSFTLVNADSDSYVGELKPGDRIELVTLGNPLLNVRANTEITLDSVLFELSSNNIPAIQRVERHLPYVLYGDGLKAGATDYWGEYWNPGQYTLKATPYRQGKADSSYSINFEVTGDLPPALRVNFGKSHTPVPAGWQTDYGLPFGQKNSYSYGWKRRDNSSPVDLSAGGTLPGNGRWRPLPKDLLLATLMHMQGNDVPAFNGTPIESYWELAVENGDYQVTVSVGDGSIWNTPESHSIHVEGEKAIENFMPQGPAGNISRFKQASVKVTVTDGYLTIDADGGTNTKINYAIIQPLSASAAIARIHQSSLLQAAESQAQLKVYPNPFSDKLQIEARLQGRVQVVIYDLMGNCYYLATHSLQTGMLDIDLSAVKLKAGLYLLKLTAEDGSAQLMRVLKQ